MFNFDRIGDIFDQFGELIFAGLISTIILSLFGTFVGLVLGVFIAYGKNWRARPNTNKFVAFWIGVVRVLCTAYSVVLRGTPMMVQALIFKYGCVALGLNWENVRFIGKINNVLNGWFIAGLIVITLNTAAYMSEIIQSGLNGVDKGQIEGARSLGMKSGETSFFVILPQAIRNALPTIGNEFITLIKETSVGAYIGIVELTKASDIIASRTYDYFFPLIIIALIYLFLTYMLSKLISFMEKRSNHARN